MLCGTGHNVHSLTSCLPFLIWMFCNAKISDYANTFLLVSSYFFFSQTFLLLWLQWTLGSLLDVPDLVVNSLSRSHGVLKLAALLITLAGLRGMHNFTAPPLAYPLLIKNWMTDRCSSMVHVKMEQLSSNCHYDIAVFMCTLRSWA